MELADRFGVGPSAIRRRLREAPYEIRRLGHRKSGGRWVFEGDDAEQVEEWLTRSFEADRGDWMIVTLIGPDPHAPPAAQLLDSARALASLHGTIQEALDPQSQAVLLAARLRYGSPVTLQFLIDLVVANHEAIATWLSVVLETVGVGLTAEALRRSSSGARLPEPRPTREVEAAAQERGVIEEYYRDRTTLGAGPLRIERVRTRRVRRPDR
jgi:hypothetical protein